MKRPVSFLLIVCVSFCATLFAAADDEEAALRKKLQEAIEEFRDQTKGKSEICPAHKIKMAVREVPVRFGLPFTFFPEFRLLKNAEFPFSDEFISDGCVVDDDPRVPTTGKVFVCAQCVIVWNRWLELRRRGQKHPNPSERSSDAALEPTGVSRTRSRVMAAVAAW